MGQAPSKGLKLGHNARVGVIGGGPAGSFFSYFFLEMAQRVGLEIALDIYEPRDFSVIGPGGCNMCGGIVSETLVQSLSAEGIHLPDAAIRRSIDSYFLHMDVGDVRIETPLHEKRIAAVHRGGGPRGMKEPPSCSLDGSLLDMAVARGAHCIQGRVDGFCLEQGRPQIRTHEGAQQTYDLVVVAVGVNSPTLKLFSSAGLEYRPPRTTKTYICEFCMGRETIKRDLGSSMHVFLLNIPRLEFAALIPKGEFVTLCMLGKEIDKELVQRFLDSEAVRQTMPANWQIPDDFCHCSPKISVGSAWPPFGDRVVFVGDCGTTRLYKDGIGAAYRTAKAAAKTAVFHGISAEDFRRHYWPVCQAIQRDNLVGRFVFAVTRLIQNNRYARRALWRMVSKEQSREGQHRSLSTVLWDTFTGSAPYRDVLFRTLHPSFIGKLLCNFVLAIRPQNGFHLKERVTWTL